MAVFDQAWVRRKGEVFVRHGGKPLCEVCGAQDDCALRASSPNACDLYRPVFSFRDSQGLDQWFNTFRRGRGWANRLELGRYVSLYDLSKDNLVGHARVHGLHVGPLGDLLEAFAPMNHLMKGLEERLAPEALHRVLRQLYGNTYAAASETFTVVEMGRVE